MSQCDQRLSSRLGLILSVLGIAVGSGLGFVLEVLVGLGTDAFANPCVV